MFIHFYFIFRSSFVCVQSMYILYICKKKKKAHVCIIFYHWVCISVFENRFVGCLLIGVRMWASRDLSFFVFILLYVLRARWVAFSEELWVIVHSIIVFVIDVISFHIWFERIITRSRILCFIIILVSLLFHHFHSTPYSVLTVTSFFGFGTLFASSLYVSSSVWFFLHCIIVVTMFTVGIFRFMAHEVFYTCCILYMRAWVLIIGYLGLVSFHFYHPITLAFVTSWVLRPHWGHDITHCVW